MPNIPSKVKHRWKSCFFCALYKGRNAVLRMFCRIKDYRLTSCATTLAANVLRAACLAAAVKWWLCGPPLR